MAQINRQINPDDSRGRSGGHGSLKTLLVTLTSYVRLNLGPHGDSLQGRSFSRHKNCWLGTCPC
jgi:hypothetical protein